MGDGAGTAPSLSFVIPFWNEEEGVDRCLDAVLAAADAMLAADAVRAVRVVAVDDGSTDATATALARRAADDPRVEVHTHDRNQGLGSALRTGLAVVATEWAFYTDADLPVAPEAAVVALEVALSQDVELVSCIRMGRHRGGWRRSAMSTVYNLAVRSLMRLPVRDVNAPAKLLHRRIIGVSLPQTTSPFCDAELLARALTSGARIAQVGVPAFARETGASSLSSPRVVAATCADLARFGWGLRARRAPA